MAAGEAALTTRAATGDGSASEQMKAKLGTALIECDLLNRMVSRTPAGAAVATGWPE